MGSMLRLSSTLLMLLFLSSGTDMVVRCRDEDLTLTIFNNCPFTIWPGIQPSAGYPVMSIGESPLDRVYFSSFGVPNEWHGTVWPRTGCTFNGSGGSCLTGDCGGRAECNGLGGKAPATLAHLSLNQPHTNVSSYSVSLVDGMNVPMTITANGGHGQCRVAGCKVRTLSKIGCPKKLQVRHGRSLIACKSACEAFRTDQYCCTKQYNSPKTCKPSEYSLMFKAACPDAYTYAHDDPSLLHHCVAPDHIKITFCP